MNFEEQYSKVINEIGELFGTYQTQAGNNITFGADSGINFQNNQGPLSTPANTGSSNEDLNSFKNGLFFHKFQKQGFYNWQAKIISNLSSPNVDTTYIAVPPGGGKTTPVVAYYLLNILFQSKQKVPNMNYFFSGDKKTVEERWLNIFRGLLHGSYFESGTRNRVQIPKLLLISPIRALINEQANDFAELFVDVFLYLYAKFRSSKTWAAFSSIKLNNPNMNNKAIYHELLNSQKWSSVRDEALVYFGPIYDENLVNALTKIDFTSNRREFDLSPGKLKSYKQVFTNWMIDHIHRKIICVSMGASSVYNASPETAAIIISVYSTAKRAINNPVVLKNLKLAVFDEAHLYQVRS